MVEEKAKVKASRLKEFGAQISQCKGMLPSLNFVRFQSTRINLSENGRIKTARHLIRTGSQNNISFSTPSRGFQVRVLWCEALLERPGGRVTPTSCTPANQGRMLYQNESKKVGAWCRLVTEGSEQWAED